MSIQPDLLGDRRVALSGGDVDLLTREVRVGGRADRLTLRETELLQFLSQRPGRTIPRDELLERVFGYRATHSSRAVDTAISRLRAKIELDPDRPAHLISVYSEGYRFEPATVEPALRVERIGIPAERTPLVGRGEEIARLLTLGAVHRAVVLVGPGGVGKTRLAARIASDLTVERAVFVPLAHTSTLADVVAEVARAIGAPTDGARTVEAATAVVGVALDGRSSTLLVLDSVEHLDGVDHLVDAWLAAAPSLRVLAASRTPLGVAGEQIVRVECLELEAAATLYVERATAAGGVVTPDDLDSIRLLVSSLDNLPLAIELAAARARSLTPVQMRGRLDARLRFLSGGPRDGEPRLASLRATLDWSWELASPEDRDALAHLSVFPGPISPSAALAVLGEGADQRISRLVSASLVQKGAEGGHTLLETVRVWAGEKADTLGIRAEAELAHAVHHAAWLVNAQPLIRPVDRASLDRVEAELPHLLAIAGRMEHVRPDLAIEVALHLWEVFQIRAPIDPYLAVVDIAVRVARATADPRLSRVLRARAMSFRLVGQVQQAEVDLEEALSVEPDAYLRAWLDGERALVLADLGRFDESEATFERVIPLLEGRHLTSTRAALGSLRTLRGHHGPDTEALLRCSLDEAEAAAWPRMAVGIRANLGILLSHHGRPEEAEVLLREAIVGLRELGALRRLPSALMGLGAVMVSLGRYDEADAISADAEAVARISTNSRWLGIAIVNRASLQMAFGDHTEGLRRLDEAEQLLASADDRWAFYLVDAYRATLFAATDRVRDAGRAAARAAAQLQSAGFEDDGLIGAVYGHVAWAEVRAMRAAGGDPALARERVLVSVAATLTGTAARFLQSMLPADGG